MVAGQARYDSIGRSYSSTRREDPRIRAHVHDAIGTAATVVNVGAGTGSYEPADRLVVAVDPSPAMVRQRVNRSPLVVDAVAENLPLASGSFDVGLAILTIHHWHDVAGGLRELARVSRRQVVFFFEPLQAHDFWALDYFPEALDVPSEAAAPGLDVIGATLAVREVRTVPVPRDCQDGFGAAYWARPEAYTDPLVQAGMSWLALLPDDVRARGTRRLRDDLASGEWERRYGHLRRHETYDGGYRIAVCGA